MVGFLDDCGGERLSGLIDRGRNSPKFLLEFLMDLEEPPLRSIEVLTRLCIFFLPFLLDEIEDNGAIVFPLGDDIGYFVYFRKWQ